MSGEKFPQYVATLAVTSIGIPIGAIIGWSSPAGQSLKYPETHQDLGYDFITSEVPILFFLSYRN
jgi:hypothetical protein